jgi:AcrR family transcriptional regulator
MARRPRSAADSRAAVFDAAVLEFSDRGFDAAGVDRIAARARVNKAMIYYHFGSKRLLYLEILRDAFQAVGSRGRTIADGDGTAIDKLDRWVVAIVEEGAKRPWLPSIMLREIASGAPHLDPDTFALMNAVFAAVKDIIEQGKREGTFRDADPLLTHLTILPPILIFFARERVRAASKTTRGLFAPRQLDQFVRHMQASARGMLRKDV